MEGYNFAALGSSHRTQAVVWAARQHKEIKGIHVIGYNAGVAQWAAVSPEVIMTPRPADPYDIISYAVENNINVVWIDSEEDLWLGDLFRIHGIYVCGPSKRATDLTETSKANGMMVCQAAGVPRPHWDCFRDYEDAAAYATSIWKPDDDHACVVKFDGFAKGAGSKVCTKLDEALEFLSLIFEGKTFPSPTVDDVKVVIQDLAHDEEVSVMAAVHNEDFILLPFVQDYKRRLEGDQGVNTGSMGCTMTRLAQISHPELNNVGDYIVNILAILTKWMAPFNGFLFPGFMGGEVLELNARLGGPECLPIIMWLREKFIDLLLFAAGAKHISQVAALPALNEDYVCVVLVDEGYGTPNRARGGDPITGLELYADDPDVIVFHDGTEFRDGNWYTKKGAGRILFIVARGENIILARGRAIKAAETIDFQNKAYRGDIGERDLKKFLQTVATAQ